MTLDQDGGSAPNVGVGRHLGGLWDRLGNVPRNKKHSTRQEIVLSSMSVRKNVASLKEQRVARRNRYVYRIRAGIGAST